MSGLGLSNFSVREDHGTGMPCRSGLSFSFVFYFICLFTDLKSIVQTHTLCTTQIDKIRQNRPLYNGILAGGITGLKTLS